ncbi:MAG TPA: DUF1566 domain-containing protein [Kiritimatiellia bacterium]|nr:DUF1566 domain-containing protein [Kiritimatiellia bacterium]HRZ12787.1 DUF1566 domain-containing protein [Kiritimatiellia bacterium]HSA18261.1 DUF1566 domain-containing protein [Kiritimatiellia bacterium]
MKRTWCALFLLAGLGGPGLRAQELCHWNTDHRFFRLNGDEGSEFVNLFIHDGGFVWTNYAVGGTVTVQSALWLDDNSWVSMEHLKVPISEPFQFWQYSDPTCVARTGQTNSYLEGDDGDLEPGHTWPDRFTVQADTNLVVDNLTGLMWARNADSGHNNWDFMVSAVYWSVAPGDYEDWRLPTVRELESLLDLKRVLPALPAGHPFNNVQLNYWTSTSDAADTNRAWVVSLGDGTIARWNRTNTSPHAWAVRAHTTGKMPVPRTGQTNSIVLGDDGHLRPGVPWPIPRFTVMTDTNLVFDNLFGRMWVRSLGMTPVADWHSAVSYCSGLAFGGYADWRLPSRREAWSLIDFGNASFLPEGHPFNGLHETFFWTSSTYRADTTRAWGIEGGHLGAHIKIDIGGGIWPVRGDW